MAQDHNLAIFRGRLKFKSNQSKIWGVFTLLSIITIIEVALGIVKPEFLTTNKLFTLKYLNWIFLILTVVKAYYITWDFMHMRDENGFKEGSCLDCGLSNYLFGSNFIN
jgi:hypothetical protein